MNSLDIIQMATSAIPTFSGRDDEAKAMLAALKMLKEAVDEQHHRIIVQAVQTKLKGQGGKIVGNFVHSIDDILKRINEHFKKTESPEDIAIVIYSMKQKTTVKDFGEKIQDLAEELKQAYLNENVTPELASEKTNRIAMKAFGKGLKNEIHQAIVLSGMIPTLDAAIKAIVNIDNLTIYKIENRRNDVRVNIQRERNKAVRAELS